jgi:hypothetical protein
VPVLVLSTIKDLSSHQLHHVHCWSSSLDEYCKCRLDSTAGLHRIAKAILGPGNRKSGFLEIAKADFWGSVSIRPDTLSESCERES